MCFLLAMAWQRSLIHALSVAPPHIIFGRGDVDEQSTTSLLPQLTGEPGVSASSFTGTLVFVTFYRATFQDGLLRW